MKNSSKKTKIVVLTGLVFAVFLGYFMSNNNNPVGLLNPGSGAGETKNIAPTVTPTPTPPVFYFDRSTDLKGELESISPQVDENAFEGLEKIIPGL